MLGHFDSVDIGRVTQVEFGPLITARTNVTEDDPGNPLNLDDCIDLTGWEYIDVYVKLSGENAYWQVVPIAALDKDSTDFYDNSSITVYQQNMVRRIQVPAVPILYFRCRNVNTSSMAVIDSIIVRPLNIKHR